MNARSLAAALLLCGALAALADAAQAGPAAQSAGEIELRKSFAKGAGGGAAAPGRPAGARSPGAGPERAPGEPAALARGAASAAALIGEGAQSSGTLRLPGFAGGDLVIDESVTPVVELANGRRLILDGGGAVGPGEAAELPRLWPGFDLLRPRAGQGLAGFLGELLDASGYASVLRAVPLTFGRGVTVRVCPDFVVLREERDLLEGEALAISVVEPADALPGELRELAAAQQVRIVELTADGLAAGEQRAPWRDPTGRVTTVGAPQPGLLLAEVAAALGLAVDATGTIRSPGDAPGGREARVVVRDGVPALALRGGADAEVPVASAPDLDAAVGALLAHFGIAAIGPVVEFHRPPARGGEPRFVVGVRGWLAQRDGRRLLITAVAAPETVRLLLTRDGFDILECRLRGPGAPPDGAGAGP